MKKIRITTLLLASLIVSIPIYSQNKENKFSDFKGKYCGQKPAGNTAKLFASGFITTNLQTRDIAMMPDGKEIYFCVSALGYNLIFFTKQDKKGNWFKPVLATFIDDYNYMFYEPCISYDGKKLFFLSNKPVKEGVEPSEDIWCVDRLGNSWSKPYNLGEPINSESAEFFPSVTKDGTMYFTRRKAGTRDHFIYRSKLVNGKYSEPEELPKQVNCGTARFNAYISPDEDFMIVPCNGMTDSYGGTDYYIVFRNKNDKWSEAINMGDQVNSKAGREFSASLSPDGKYLFFMSNRANPENDLKKNTTLSDLIKMNNDILNGSSNIFWIETSFIKDLRKKAKF